MDITDLNAMIDAYTEAALWSSIDDNGKPLNANYDESDLSEDAQTEFRNDCEGFFNGNVADLIAMDAGQAGHDFWLTRNRHGAGFWGRGLGELGERLTESAHVYGTVEIYVGDDGNLYIA
jgi:hypothetical protein